MTQRKYKKKSKEYELPSNSTKFQLPSKTKTIAKAIHLPKTKPGLQIDYNMNLLPIGNNALWKKESLYAKAKQPNSIASWLLQ